MSVEHLLLSRKRIAMNHGFSIMSADEADCKFMKTYGILKWNELAKLSSDRISLSHKIAYGLATREELLVQIKVESNLFDICQLKIDQEMKVNDTEEINTEVLTILSNHVNDMYNNLFLLFPVEHSSLSEYIQFCSNNKLFITNCSNTLNELMTRYHQDPQIYIAAATFEFDDRTDVEAARRYFAEGLKYHNNNEKLCLEEFWVEVQQLEKSAGASLPIALKKYRDLIVRFENDVEFHLKLLERVLRLRSVRELQRNVVRDMVKKYAHSELIWQRLAKMNFDGYFYDHKHGRLLFHGNYVRGIHNCIQTYELGLKKNVAEDNKHKLWNFYIDHIIEIRNSYRMQNKTIKHFMDETLDCVFDEAHESKFLKVDHYIYWANNVDQGKIQILDKGMKTITNSPELWSLLLGYYLNCDFFHKGLEIFQQGVQQLQDKSSLLWKMMIRYIHSTHENLIDQVYEKGAHEPYKNISMEIRPKFLEWVVLKKGIPYGRDLFYQLKDLEPRCLKLYSTMITFELSQPNKKKRTIRKLYNEACDIFGNDNVGIWADCIKFEFMYGLQSYVKIVYEASLVYLEPEYRSSMKETFEMLKEEYGEDDVGSEVILIDDD